MSHDFPDGPDYNPEPIDDDPWDVHTASAVPGDEDDLWDWERGDLIREIRRLRQFDPAEATGADFRPSDT